MSTTKCAVQWGKTSVGVIATGKTEYSLQTPIGELFPQDRNPVYLFPLPVSTAKPWNLRSCPSTIQLFCGNLFRPPNAFDNWSRDCR